MISQTESSFKKTWNILVPFLVYFVVHDLAQVLLAFLFNLSLGVFGKAYAEYMIAHAMTVNGVLNAFSLVIGMASVWPMARKELAFVKAGREEKSKEKETDRQNTGRRAEYALLASFAISLSLGANILLILMGIVESSAAFGDVAVRQYGVSFGAGLIIYGILSPVAEEIVFRGLIYNRMKRYFPAALSVIVCGILFGVYHGNLVQGIYGSILGIAITFSYELLGSFLVPVLFHAIANISVFIVGYNPQTLSGLTNIPCCIVFLAISLVSLFLMLKVVKGKESIY